MNTPSEQTPLLTLGPYEADRWLFVYSYARNLGEWSILTLDIVIGLPFIPVCVAREILSNAMLANSWKGEFPILVTVLAIVLGLWFAFGPTLLFCVAWFLSYKLTRLLHYFYQFKRGRVAVRIVAGTAMVWGLWQCIDLRHEYTRSDLPPLSDTGSSIRLLDVLPAGEGHRIEGHLRTVELGDNPTYAALSYEWGNAHMSQSISVHGKRFRVTENLWKALHNIRHTTETRTLWVDAICIDQTSIREKNSQVPLMSFIYQRARTVLISLGKHVPPRWVDRSDPSTWNPAWALQTAEAYWGSTHYWLEQLALEEYWKRCWVVQEIGSGLSIEVYAGRQSIPWTRFVELMGFYAEKQPQSTLPERILRFDHLRRALYQDGETYKLSQLLMSFRDSFCSVNLDKILAFTGMAVDCQGGCLPVDYAAGVKPLYDSVISSQNESNEHNLDGKIEMVYLSALVRSLLSRQHRKVTKEYEKPGWIHQPESWSYYWCGDEELDFCVYGPEIMLAFPFLEYLRAPFSAGKGMSLQSSVWLPPVAEVKETWASLPGQNLGGIKIVGAITGEVQEVGPTYGEYLQDPRVSRQWSARLSAKYPAASDQRRARGLNARLSALLGPAADSRLADVVPAPSYSPEDMPTKSLSGQRLFLGGEDITMGLIPFNARVGDKLCQFWNSSAVAVLRARTDGDRYDVVGRGLMLQRGDEVNWDVPTNKTMFRPETKGSRELDVDLDTLNHLSFDIVSLPAS